MLIEKLNNAYSLQHLDLYSKYVMPYLKGILWVTASCNVAYYLLMSPGIVLCLLMSPIVALCCLILHYVDIIITQCCPESPNECRPTSCLMSP